MTTRAQGVHPIALIRKQAQSSGQGLKLLEGCLEMANAVAPYSRRAARLLERIGLERPSLKLSGLLAELSTTPAKGGGHKGIPQILVDKLAVALGEMFAGRAPKKLTVAPQLAKLASALDDLEKTTRAVAGNHASARELSPRIARVSLDENPPAFFYSEGRGLESVPSGMAVMLADLGARPLSFVAVRGPLLDVEARLYAIERMRDVILEPIADEGARLLTLLASGTVVRLALLEGGGLRVTLRDLALAYEIGLEDGDRDNVGLDAGVDPGRYVVLSSSRAKDIVAALAARDDVTIAWSSVARFHTDRASVKQLKVQLGERRDWLGIDGGVTLDDGSAVSVLELLRALREGRRYVVVGKDKLVAIGEDLANALDPLAATASPTAPALSALVDAGAHVEDSAGWRALKEDLAKARDVDGVPSPLLRAELRPYQRDGVRFLRRLAAWGTGGVLADDMGLGKTVQAIALLLDRALLSTTGGPALVVAPTSVCFNWADELAKFAPTLRVVRYEGVAGARKRALADAQAGDVVIASYALVQRDVDAFANVEVNTLILDEAQQVKNASTRRAKSVRAVRAGFRVALTGTPLENHTGELWAIFDAVAPGLFGSWTEFKSRFATPIEKDHDVRRRRTLAHAIAPFVLRRKKKDVAPDLPPRTEVSQRLPLDVDERRAYDRVRQALLLDIVRPKDERREERKLEAAEKRVKILAAITKLRLVACHQSFAGDTHLPPEQTPPGTKQRALVELLLELKESGHKALVFSQFVRHLELARAAATAAGITSLQLDGSTPAKEREQLVARFQKDDDDAFFLSLKAGGTGLNLTRASYVVHLDPWWNPAVEDQATDRAHRIGQTEPVTVVRLIAEDTLEEQILELHEDKRALVEGVLAGTATAATLSVDELMDIVSHTRRTPRAEDHVQEWALPDEEAEADGDGDG